MQKRNQSGVVYSTDKNFKFENEEKQNIMLRPEEQKLKMILDSKHRGGKPVTLITGYIGNDIEETGRKLKVFCGTGGSVKDGEIIVQGDNRDKVLHWLLKNGFKNVKRI